MPRSHNHSSEDSDSSSGGGGDSYSGATHLDPRELDRPYIPARNHLFQTSTPALTLPDVQPSADHSYHAELYPSQFDPGTARLGMGGMYGYPLAESPDRGPDDWNPGHNVRQTYTPSPRDSPPTEFEFPDAGDFIRGRLNLPADADLTLEAFPDPPEGARPTLSLPHLAMLAIHNSPRKMLTLQEIYIAIENRFEWYRNADEKTKKKWQGSIRHTLSLKSVFRHKPRPITEPGKGQYWYLDPTQGDGYKRERRRKTRNQRHAGADQDDDDEYSDQDSQPSDPTENIDHRMEGGARPIRTSSGRRRSPYSTAGSSLRTQGYSGSGRPPSRPQLMHARSTPQLHPTPNQFTSSSYPDPLSFHTPYPARSGFNGPSLAPQSLSNPAFGHPSFPINPSLPPTSLYNPSSYHLAPPSDGYRFDFPDQYGGNAPPFSGSMYAPLGDVDPKHVSRVRGF